MKHISNKIKRLLPLLALFGCLDASPLFAQSKGEQLPAWEEGFLDIHQIATGRGNSAFAMLPDGTTLLIDAGDLGDRVGLNQLVMPALPNDTKLPGEWIATYVNHFTALAGRESKLDYVLLTHHHNDHVGGVSSTAIQVPGRNYVLSGITQVAEHLPIGKLVDRGWPDYDYPSRQQVEKATVDFKNYLNFIDYQQSERKTVMERFDVGKKDQMKLRYQAEKYPNFHIRNIYSSGRVWTGTGNASTPIFPGIEALDPKDYPSENMSSNAIKLTYGKFNYFTGGDITGIIGANQPLWRDVESVVGPIVGAVEVAVANHHGYTDAANENFIKALQPQVFVLPVWDFYHPQPQTLSRMVDRTLYPNERRIFATGLVEENKTRLGELAKHIEPFGHVLIRVYPEGNTFQVFVLNAQSEDYEIIYKGAIQNAN